MKIMGQLADKNIKKNVKIILTWSPSTEVTRKSKVAKIILIE